MLRSPAPPCPTLPTCTRPSSTGQPSLTNLLCTATGLGWAGLRGCRRHEFANKGLGATGSGLFAACTERMVGQVGGCAGWGLGAAFWMLKNGEAACLGIRWQYAACVHLLQQQVASTHHSQPIRLNALPPPPLSPTAPRSNQPPHLLPQDADLVVLEFSLNDAADAPYPSAERRGYEQLLRNLLALPGGPPALIQLHHHRWHRALPDSDVIESGLFYETPAESQLTTFAQVRPGGSYGAIVGQLWRYCGAASCVPAASAQTSQLAHSAAVPAPNPWCPPPLPCSTTIFLPSPCGRRYTR